MTHKRDSAAVDQAVFEVLLIIVVVFVAACAARIGRRIYLWVRSAEKERQSGPGHQPLASAEDHDEEAGGSPRTQAINKTRAATEELDSSGQAVLNGTLDWSDGRHCEDGGNLAQEGSAEATGEPALLTAEEKAAAQVAAAMAEMDASDQAAAARLAAAEGGNGDADGSDSDGGNSMFIKGGTAGLTTQEAAQDDGSDDGYSVANSMLITSAARPAARKKQFDGALLD